MDGAQQLKLIVLYLIFIVGFILLYPKGNKRERIALLICLVIVIIVSLLYSFN